MPSGAPWSRAAASTRRRPPPVCAPWIAVACPSAAARSTSVATPLGTLRADSGRRRRCPSRASALSPLAAARPGALKPGARPWQDVGEWRGRAWSSAPSAAARARRRRRRLRPCRASSSPSSRPKHRGPSRRAASTRERRRRALRARRAPWSTTSAPDARRAAAPRIAVQRAAAVGPPASPQAKRRRGRRAPRAPSAPAPGVGALVARLAWRGPSPRCPWRGRRCRSSIAV